MKNKILSYLLGWLLVLPICFIFWYVQAEGEHDIDGWTIFWNDELVITPEKEECAGIKLNTNFPIIWNCIETWKGGTDSTQAFPKMIWALTKIVMALILVACFITIIVAWIMLASAWEDQQQTKTARDWIKRVAITILLLWFSWAILRLINPNFFG